MAAVVAIGGDGLARVAAARALGGRGRNQRGGEMQGCRGALGALQQQRRQAGGGRVRAGVRRPRAPAYWREVGDDWHLQWAGLLQ